MKRTANLDRRPYAGNNLRNKTVGIIGIGHIGRRVAELCGVLFNNTVLAYDPYLAADEIAARGAAKVELGGYRFYDERKSVNGKESCGTFHSQELDHRSLNIYTMMVSSILYFQRNTTGAALISSKYWWIRSINSCLLATRSPRSMVRVILLN